VGVGQRLDSCSDSDCAVAVHTASEPQAERWFARVCFFPAIVSLLLGQDSILLLAVFCICYRLLLTGREFPAGIVLSFACIKFQYVLLLLIMLMAWRKFRLVAGVVAGCIALLIASVLVTGPSGLMQYAHFLYAFDRHSGYGTLHPEVMVSWRGFFDSVAGSGVPHAYWFVGEVLLLVFGIVLLAVARSNKVALPFAFATSLAFAGSRYAHFPDLTVVLLPALIAADHVVTASRWRAQEKFLAVSGVLLFVWPLLVLVVEGRCCWIRYSYLSFPVLFLFIGAVAWSLIRKQDDEVTLTGMAAP
jgi:hypothetical protein